MGCCCSNPPPPSLGSAPDSFPKGFEAYYQQYQNWAKDNAFKCPKILVAYPRNEDDVLAICRWAVANDFRVRPTGQRHNWSPLTIAPGTSGDNNIVILDMRAHIHHLLKAGQPGFLADEKAYQITVQPGMMLGDLLEHMEKKGMGFPHTPAPYDITVGGITAINGHGTKIASAEEFTAGKTNNFGTVSNRIIAMRVVAYEEGKNGAAGQYVLRNFTAKDPEFPALQCAVGRTLAVAITFQCVPNYNVRCRTTFKITDTELFPKPPQDAQGNFIIPDDSKPVGARFPVKSYAYYVDKYGSAETIHFPFTKNPWLKVWTEVSESGPGVDYSRKITESCPFTGADHVPLAADYLVRTSLGINEDPTDFKTFVYQRDKDTSTMRESCCGAVCGCCRSCCPCCCGIKVPDSFPCDDDRDLFGYEPRAAADAIADTFKYTLGIAEGQFGNPDLIQKFGPVLESVAQLQVQSENVWDVYGPSKNTQLYCRSTTALITANGYAVWLPRRKLQLGVWLFMDMFCHLRDDMASKSEYPFNMPVEIRVVGPDYKDAIKGNNCAPYLSGCNPDGVPQDILNDDPVILYLDNLTYPGSPSAPKGFALLEKGLVDVFTKNGMFVRPEWSKGWAYTAETGAYSSKWFMDLTRHSIANWNTAIDIFDKLDPKKLFCNAFLENFMAKVDESGCTAVAAKQPQANNGAATAGPTAVPNASNAPVDGEQE